MRFLLIAPEIPWPQLRHGAAQRTELLQRALSEIGTVDRVILPLGDNELSADENNNVIASYDEYPTKPINIKPGPFFRLRTHLSSKYKFYAKHPEAAQQIKSLLKSGQYDLVATRYLRTAALAGIQDHDSNVPWVIDMDDVDWLKASRENPGKQTKGLQRLKAQFNHKLYTKSLENFCRNISSCANGIWVPSEREQTGILPLQSTVLPNIPFEPPSELIPEHSNKKVLFIGLLNYMPNVSGLDWFIKKVWPTVLEEEPSATFEIIGRGLDSEIKTEWEKIQGVTVYGFVDDLKKFYREAAITVCPIWEGGGTQIKILESLAFSRVPVVSSVTANSLAGYFKHDTHFMVANTEIEFSKQVVLMLKEPGMRATISESGFRQLNNELSYSKFQSIVKHMVNEVVK